MLDIRGLLNGGLDAFGKTSSERWKLLVQAVIELQKRTFNGGGGGSSSSAGSGSGSGSGNGGNGADGYDAETAKYAERAVEADHAKKADKATEAGHAETADKAYDIADNSAFHKRFLHRDQEDYAEEEIGFVKGLWIKTKGLFGIDKDGNATLSSIHARNTLKVDGETILKSVSSVGNFEKDIQVGIGSRQGIRMNPDGSIIARSLELSESLQVPMIKYNSIEVLSGTRWDSAGKGKVKEIISIDDDHHLCTFVLDLSDGEPGEFVVGDILRGFWHNMDGSKNASANSDDKHGNINRAGFMSIYCRVVSVGNVVERKIDDEVQYIAKDNNYQAREGDIVMDGGLVTVMVRQFVNEQGETVRWSPYPEQWSVLSVSGSFAADHPERQNFFVYTTTYMARFMGVNTWEWEDHCFMGGWGDLTGFTMMELDENEQVIYQKEFNGEGFVTKDAHIYGVLDQFTRFSDKIEIVLSRPDGTIANDETIRADFVLKTIDDQILTGGYRLGITRQSGDSVADAAWNANIATTYPDGIPSALLFRYADVPQFGAVFVVSASRQVEGGDGEQTTYTTSASFLLTRAVIAEDFMGEWNALTTYIRSSRRYPTVTWGGCKWWLAVDTSTGDEPYPGSSVWKMMYGVSDMEIRFYDANGQRIISASQVPGAVDLYLDPRLFCGNFDITNLLDASDWVWSRYTGNYGEAIDTRTPANRQSDQGWPSLHWQGQTPTRQLRILNGDMPPTWGSGPKVNFIITATYDGLEIPNIVTM